MSKILICGDSFAVDYKKINGTTVGWPSRLAETHTITNRAQAGVCEYQILKQLERENLNNYDAIIVSHTSPNRVYIQQHPVYKNNILHQHADLIYSDVLYHLEKEPNNVVLNAAKEYFENIYDQDYQEDLYFLIVDRIQELLNSHLSLHLTTLFDKKSSKFKNHLNLFKICKISPGNINHYDEVDNNKVYNLVNDWINNHV